MNSQLLELENASPQDCEPGDAPVSGHTLSFSDTLPIVDPALIDPDLPGDVAQAVLTLLQPNEAVFVILRLHSQHHFSAENGKGEKSPIWTVVTGTRMLLVAVASDGRVYSDAFEQNSVVEYQNGLSGDSLKIAETSLFSPIWQSNRHLFKEAARLFPMPEYEKYLSLAEMTYKKGNALQAAPLLQQSLDRVPTLKACTLLLALLLRYERHEEAEKLINSAFDFADPFALFEEMQRLFPENAEMPFYLAAACEERRNWDACVYIYQRMAAKTPDFDLYYLKLGEMFNARREYAAAIQHYEKFIALRASSEKFQKGVFHSWDISEMRWFSADPDVAKAYFDLGLIYEYELRRLDLAAQYYFALLRHAPFYVDAYKHFWLAYQQCREQAAPTPPLHIQSFLDAYRLLAPQNYAAVVTPEQAERLTGGLSNSFARLPERYARLKDDESDLLIHPGEQEYFNRIQHWLTSLVVANEDGQGIAAYCEQVKMENYPNLYQTIERLADFLDMMPPKCFISRGKIGMSVRNMDEPFIFIGSEHLQPENDRFFSMEEFVFMIAAQIEHIKSGHLLITDTELWKSLGSASFDGFLVALQCLPAGGFLGRLTHHVATKGLKKIYKMTKTSGVHRFLDFFLKPSEHREDAAKDDAEHLEQDAECPPDKAATKPETLFKEQVVEFARHAIYTADRVGLLACNSLHSACSAIFKVAGQHCQECGELATHGLCHILEKRDKHGNFLYFEHAKRFGELIKFALSEPYFRLHERVVALPKPTTVAPLNLVPAATPSETALLTQKLQLLEHSLRNELLSPEEFLRKQRALFENAAAFHEKDLRLLEKLEQGFLDGILTVEELQQKLFRMIEKSKEEGGEPS